MIVFLPLLVLKVVVFLLIVLLIVLPGTLFERRKEILKWCRDVKVSPANRFNLNHSESIWNQI